jgi:hypothetical protein
MVSCDQRFDVWFGKRPCGRLIRIVWCHGTPPMA